MFSFVSYSAVQWLQPRCVRETDTAGVTEVTPWLLDQCVRVSQSGAGGGIVEGSIQWGGVRGVVLEWWGLQRSDHCEPCSEISSWGLQRATVVTGDWWLVPVKGLAINHEEQRTLSRGIRMSNSQFSPPHKWQSVSFCEAIVSRHRSAGLRVKCKHGGPGVNQTTWWLILRLRWTYSVKSIQKVLRNLL